MADIYKFSDPGDFEKVIAIKLKERGFEVIIPPANTKGYDIEIIKNEKKCAVQVKNYTKQSISQPAVKRLFEFIESTRESKKFDSGIFITTTTYAKTVTTYLKGNEIENIILLTFDVQTGELKTFDSKEENFIKEQKKSAKYIGVFTSKGGVGKTTVSAHLAGGFAINGYDVILLDLDVQGNLRKLMGEGVTIPPDNTDNFEGSSISVFDYNDWGEEKDTQIVICDCNPEFDKNPLEIMKKFDYCIVPTTLNPLGINKNANVIKRTFELIRGQNTRAKLFVLINGYHDNKKDMKRNKKLNNMLKANFEDFFKKDSNVYYIDPIDDFAIRYSNSLVYWGYDTLIEGEEPSLAFKRFGGKSHPRSDFINLAGYIEEHTDIDTTS